MYRCTKDKKGKTEKTPPHPALRNNFAEFVFFYQESLIILQFLKKLHLESEKLSFLFFFFFKLCRKIGRNWTLKDKKPSYRTKRI